MIEKHGVIHMNPFYKDNAKKEKAWSLIAGVVGVEVEYYNLPIIFLLLD